MQLLDWVHQQGHGAIARLSQASGVSRMTIHEALRRAPISRYVIAKKLSEATGGAVTVVELQDPANPTEPAWKKNRRARATSKSTKRRGRPSSKKAKRKS